MKENIRYIRIPLAVCRSKPDNHVAYEIQVQGPVRSWTLWRRYSEFDKLDQDFAASYPGIKLAYKLPPKRFTLFDWKIIPKSLYSLSSTGSNIPFLNPCKNNIQSDDNSTLKKNAANRSDVGSNSASENDHSEELALEDREFIETRRKGLENYLQSILNDQNQVFRDSQLFHDFISPSQSSSRSINSNRMGIARSPTLGSTSKENKAVDNRVDNITSANWMQMLSKAEKLTLSVRHLIEQRETLLSRNDISTSHQSNLQAKRNLSELSELIDQLNTGLSELEANSSSMGSGSSIPSLIRVDSIPKSPNLSLDKLSSLFHQSSPQLSTNSEMFNQKQIVTQGEALRRRDKLLALMEEKHSLDILIRGINNNSQLKTLTKPSSADKAALLSTGDDAVSGYGDRILKSFGYFTSLSNNFKKSTASTTEPNTVENVSNDISNSSSEIPSSPHSAPVNLGSRSLPNRSARVFGKRQFGKIKAVETEQTSGLDNREISNLQVTMMKEQDNKVQMFSEILQRQKAIGSAINNELEIHNQLLGDLSTDLDRTSDRISSARRQANKII
ncbi:putative syntaxin-8B [Smittium mucronatum]|uniref:Putative syntaxin-8B n=1 Tax=Smittium mucronatum TaxID=133383 RepID=A0A1R0H015_9FUNG|nr:putative syntaxin-8B [Smittium mucronatum]